ncbi:type I-B CRISPR-associated protein Cas7/Csh2 [Runella aurantiaca]|uniref:Type I-B CRISPR-associated protein Cas7/Csh2 n=1 Tax=Runella aurantiaca TaxID=2282308 RepID=A0A369HYL6_9BACT|nr:type I-B CRISPR-associated protein Cas7/Csh2 [Runella aurantiaca]RDB02448.1 type I-B CRISPR-associated protein Cas7/Csh2 [Runella aurantiaca]
MSDTIKNRSEILFLYEIENANPNGDPMNENRPRFDSEDGTALVSDVRIKRTIRDYWYEYKGFNGKEGKDIFVRETEYQDGDKSYISDGKRRAKAFGESRERVLKECIDIRVFGGVIPLEKDSITLTGPVQFQMGRSLHQTEVTTEQGTGAFASGDKKSQATFRTEYKLPYALIGVNGIVNEKAAQYSTMSEDDKSLLLEGIWEGTKNLISRSKFGQSPVLLINIDYKEAFYIGNLRQRIKIISGKNDLEIRGLEDVTLDISDLTTELKKYSDKIDKITVKADSRLKIQSHGEVVSIQNETIDLNAL